MQEKDVPPAPDILGDCYFPEILGFGNGLPEVFLK